jgi:hypothetical protein
MNSGLLWFDDSKESLEVKVKKAVEYYFNKYHRHPNLCLVHPSSMDGNWPQNIVEMAGSTVTVRAYRPVLPGHLWIGIEEETKHG